jgi:hypothetical protein
MIEFTDYVKQGKPESDIPPKDIYIILYYVKRGKLKALCPKSVLAAPVQSVCHFGGGVAPVEFLEDRYLTVDKYPPEDVEKHLLILSRQLEFLQIRTRPDMEGEYTRQWGDEKLHNIALPRHVMWEATWEVTPHGYQFMAFWGDQHPDWQEFAEGLIAAQG